MKRQTMGPVWVNWYINFPRLGKLVHQLPGVVTLAYDLCLTRMIARWKDLSEDYDGKDDFLLK